MIDEAPKRVSGLESFGSDWMPIETAPKDGTRVLVLEGKGIYVSRYYSTDCQEFGKTVSHSEGWMSPYMMGKFEPTRWMPLPPLPGDAT